MVWNPSGVTRRAGAALRCRVARSQREIDDALRIRWEVFGRELRLMSGPMPPAPREVDCFDTLESTVHLVVYEGDTPVATSRLLLPNPEVARVTGSPWGIALEAKLDLSGVRSPGILLAESTRFCILRPWRHSLALLHLQAGLYRESRRRGVTHWIASANTETDWPEDARMVFQVAAHKGWVSQRWRLQPRALPELPSAPNAPFYTPAERTRALEGQYGGLRMPRPLSLFAGKMGARFIGEPLYDAHFHRFSMPLLAALEEIPASTLAWLGIVDPGPSLAA